jgi:hypothetical protein
MVAVNRSGNLNNVTQSQMKVKNEAVSGENKGLFQAAQTSGKPYVTNANGHKIFETNKQYTAEFMKQSFQETFEALQKQVL